MEKEVVWSTVAKSNFWEIVIYLKDNWPKEVLDRFAKALELKVQLLQKQPYIGFKSSSHSRFRKTLITKSYILIYSITKDRIVIHKLKQRSQNL